MQCRRPRFDSWVRKIPWRREWQPTPVFLPGESRGPRSLAGYNSWGRKESDMTERLTHTCIPTYIYLLAYINSSNLSFQSKRKSFWNKLFEGKIKVNLGRQDTKRNTVRFPATSQDKLRNSFSQGEDWKGERKFLVSWGWECCVLFVNCL